ncbi:MAG: hypothetical protein ABW003_22840 [Microvirga sp.]
MSQLHLSDEILMAFADGELDEPAAGAIEQAMLSNPAITQRVIGFLRSRRLIRSAFTRDVALSVPPELQAAVQAQISAFEAANDRGDAEGTIRPRQNAFQRRHWLSGGMALAASVAALAIAGVGYFAGQQNIPSPHASGLVARLEDPLVRQVLDTGGSGQEAELAIGRIRMVSTYRLANGFLCREFTLQAASGKAAAIACRTDDWKITFALASPAADAVYTPSSGGDLMAAYLQDIGVGEPLLGATETKALTEKGR